MAGNGTANSFGCGEGGTAAAPISQYVQSINTDEKGVITVTARAINQLGKKNQVSFTPYADAALTTPMAAADYNRASLKTGGIKGWQCSAVGNTGIDAKFLPASCR